MYLHHILKRPKTELINRFYRAQKLKPSKNDWVKQIEEDIKELKLELTDKYIKKLSKYKFKKILEETIGKKAFEYLIKKKDMHSKVEHINFEKLELQKYLKANSTLDNEEKYLLFKFRTRMMQMKTNYRNNFTELKCKLGCKEEDEQSHLFQCDVLINNCENLANNVTVEYEDIFSTEISKQTKAIKLLTQIWSTRLKLIE